TTREQISSLLIIFMLIVVMLSLVFSVVSLVTNLYLSKDSEFFLALPIKPGTVFFAKVTYIYFAELLLSTAILLPAGVLIGAATGMGAWYFVSIVAAVIAAPIFALILAALLALPLMFVVSFFRARAVFTSVTLIVIFGVVMGLYYSTLGKFGDGANGDVALAIANAIDSMVSAAYFVPPLSAIAYLATGSHKTLFGEQTSLQKATLINVGMFLGGLLVLLCAIFALAQVVYKRGLRSNLESSKKNTKQSKDREESVSKALAQKEWKEMLRTPAIAFQCFSVVVLAPMMTFLFSNLTTSFGALTEVSDSAAAAGPLKALLYLLPITTFMFASTGISNSAGSIFSREGNRFYYIKMLPIAPIVAIRAKLRVSFWIAMIATVAMLVLYIVLTSQYLAAALSLGFSVIYAYGMINFAATFDIKKPRLVWTTPTEAVKHNSSVYVPALFNLLFIFVVVTVMVVLSAILSVSGFAFWEIILIVFAAICGLALLFAILTHKKVTKMADECVYNIEV
ncbi:MAG: hypothetical protein FWD76_05690, partial [Firmicutes bacterium]|nr:hypothetical protein [Bacillota bacterium]